MAPLRHLSHDLFLRGKLSLNGKGIMSEYSLRRIVDYFQPPWSGHEYGPNFI